MVRVGFGKGPAAAVSPLLLERALAFGRGCCVVLAKLALAYAHMGFPVSSNDFRSLRIQDQPPPPISENFPPTIPAMVGAPSSSSP
jgi:hypothetical protein